MQSKSVFPSFRKIDANKEDCRVFSHFRFLVFYGAKNLLPGKVNNLLAAPSATWLEYLQKHPPGEQQTQGRFLIGDVLNSRLPRVKRNILRTRSIFWEFFVLLALNFECTQTPCGSFPAAYVRLLSGPPDALTHPIRSPPSRAVAVRK